MSETAKRKGQKERFDWIHDVISRMAQRLSAAGLTWLVTAVIILSACSTTKPPTETLARAELGVRAASEARADELAPVDLKIARDKLEKAKHAMASSNYDEARRLAEAALVDAELAEAKAEAEIVRRAADDMQRRVDAHPTEAERESRKPFTTAPNKE